LTGAARSGGKYSRRFDGRAGAYSRYRPGYPAQILDWLRREIGFGREAVVADIGSGTGILSELFLRNGNTVFCVEPNGGMRKVAERRLAKYGRRFVSVDGTAEDTGLDGGSVDLITVGQALHWFDLPKTGAEFGRILSRGGFVAIVYNYRKERGAVEQAYERVVARFARRSKVPKVDNKSAVRFLAGGEVRRVVMPNSQTLDLGEMLGRLASASYMPRPASREWAGVERAVRGIFDEYGDDGKVVLRYRTALFLGKVRAP